MLFCWVFSETNSVKGLILFGRDRFTFDEELFEAKMSKQLDLNDAPAASPLRRKSLAARTPVRTNTLPIQDNEAELLARRRRESTLITADNRRHSFGVSYISQLNNDQLQKKCLECVQLNIDNKISMKNAFSVPAIDMLTYFVKENSNPDLQIASSTLDVSSKVYGLRVDKVYMEVNKMCSNMGQKNIGNEDMEEPVNGEEQDEENRNPDQVQKKKKRLRRTNVFSTVEALRGNVETISLESLISAQDDPQTSDFLSQVQTVFSTKDGCNMKNFGGPVLDDLEGVTAGEGVFSNPIVDHSSISIRKALSFTFSFLHCNDDSDPEMSFDQEMDVDSQQQADVFHFDIDEVPDPTPFPSQDVAVEVQVQNRRAAEPAPFIVDFQDIITSQISQRESEYSFVPLDLIKFNGPNYWKIEKRRDTSVLVNKERCKPAKKKEVVLDYPGDAQSDAKFSSGSRTKISENTQCAWTEENNSTYNYYDKFAGLEMFHSYTQKDHQFKKIRQPDVNAPEQNVIPEINSDADDNLAAMDDDMDFHNRTDDGDRFDNPPIEQNNENEVAGETEMEPLSQGQFLGDNLVSAPHVVDENNVFIPYSKRAKKINVRQVKQSMMQLINNKFEGDENAAPNGGEATYDFSELYQNLPRFLSRSNAEAMSVPIAFVSLLHLANEQTLAIEPVDFFEDLTIKSDAKEHSAASKSN